MIKDTSTFVITNIATFVIVSELFRRLEQPAAQDDFINTVDDQDIHELFTALNIARGRYLQKLKERIES